MFCIYKGYWHFWCYNCSDVSTYIKAKISPETSKWQMYPKRVLIKTVNIPLLLTHFLPHIRRYTDITRHYVWLVGAGQATRSVGTWGGRTVNYGQLESGMGWRIPRKWRSWIAAHLPVDTYFIVAMQVHDESIQGWRS